MHWPMTLYLRVAPGPTTRASGLRQRSAEAALKRNLNKAKQDWVPFGKAAPGATGSASEELALRPHQRRRLLANCAGGSRPLQRLLANLAGCSRRSLQRVLANCAGDAQRLLAGPELVELAVLAELAE